MHLADRYSLYDRLMSLPDNLTGEILNGQLHTQPRPTGPHARAEGRLFSKVGRGYDEGEGGPGGWWIIIEPEVHFVRDTEVVVPDIAGWRRERMPDIPTGHRFEAVPDWICEILSPSSASKDREIKMPIYVHFGVRYAWLVDPLARTLDTFEAKDGAWASTGAFAENDVVNTAPFEAVSIRLTDLWS